MDAKFKRSELRGWVKYSDSFLGLDDNGEYKYQIIGPGEKVDVVYVFEGEYLGGTANEKLSFPEEMVLLLS